MPPFHLVDAFTDRPFTGNPAGVVVLDGPVEQAWAQAVAAEVRASETAFVSPRPDGWQLRWWTPRVEVELCGHATLAAAHVLIEEGLAPPDLPVNFHTRSGRLRAVRRGPQVAMDLPAWPLAPHPEPAGLAAALGGVIGRYLGRSTGSVQAWDVVELRDEAEVRAVRPDLAVVAALGSTGLIVTAAGNDVDLVSRVFAPAVGVDEDPVTGSAHSTLGPLWAARLGRTRLTARQCSPRGGRLDLEVGADRVEVAGRAVTVIRGRIAGPV